MSSFSFKFTRFTVCALTALFSLCHRLLYSAKSVMFKMLNKKQMDSIVRALEVVHVKKGCARDAGAAILLGLLEIPRFHSVACRMNSYNISEVTVTAKATFAIIRYSSDFNYSCARYRICVSSSLVDLCRQQICRSKNVSSSKSHGRGFSHRNLAYHFISASPEVNTT